MPLFNVPFLEECDVSDFTGAAILERLESTIDEVCGDIDQGANDRIWDAADFEWGG